MERSTNALAELAERLASNEVRVVEGDEFPIHLSTDAILDFRKARRIIEELAKVGDVTEVHNLEPVQVPNGWQCYDAVVRSRAIAEEGAKDA